MSEVKAEIYYVVFTDKETGLIGAQNCVDYETAVKKAELMQYKRRYTQIEVTSNAPLTSFYERTHRGL